MKLSGWILRDAPKDVTLDTFSSALSRCDVSALLTESNNSFISIEIQSIAN